MIHYIERAKFILNAQTPINYYRGILVNSHQIVTQVLDQRGGDLVGSDLNPITKRMRAFLQNEEVFFLG